MCFLQASIPQLRADLPLYDVVMIRVRPVREHRSAASLSRLITCQVINASPVQMWTLPFLVFEIQRSYHTFHKTFCHTAYFALSAKITEFLTNNNNILELPSVECLFLS